jgi:PAS domain-containing protein
MDIDRIRNAIASLPFSMRDADITVNASLRVSYLSAGACDLFKVTRENMLHQKLWSLWPHGTRMTYERHEATMNAQFEVWYAQITKGSNPEGQPMGPRASIEFKGGDYQAFRAKIGFFPLPIGYTYKEIRVNAIPSDIEPELDFEDKIDRVRNFCLEQDCLHCLVQIQRIDFDNNEIRQREELDDATEEPNPPEDKVQGVLWQLERFTDTWKGVTGLAILAAAFVSWLFFGAPIPFINGSKDEPPASSPSPTSSPDPDAPNCVKFPDGTQKCSL